MEDLETITETELLARGAVIRNDSHKRPYAKIEPQDKPMQLYRPLPAKDGEERQWYCFSVHVYKEGAD